MNETLCDFSRRYLCAEPFVVGPDTDTGITDPLSARLGRRGGPYLQRGRRVRPIRRAVHRGGFGTATTLRRHRGQRRLSRRRDFARYRHLDGRPVPAGRASVPRGIGRAPQAIGTNTVHAMQSGLVFGFAGQTDAMVERFRRELGDHARVIATGGLAELIHRESRTIEVVDQLVTLEGLRLLFEMQKTQDTSG